MLNGLPAPDARALALPAAVAIEMITILADSRRLRRWTTTICAGAGLARGPGDGLASSRAMDCSRRSE